jgi:hypothetical protein
MPITSYIAPEEFPQKAFLFYVQIKVFTSREAITAIHNSLLFSHDYITGAM